LVLFPGQHEVFGKDFREEANWSLVARRGIGSRAGFDAYFSLFPSPDDVPKTVIDMAIAKLNERSFLVDLIDSYVQKTDRNNLSMVPKLLRELAFRFMGRNAVIPTQDLFEALFEKADNIFSIDWRADPLQLSPNAALIDLSDQMLEVWGPDAAAQHLESAFSKSRSLVLSADIFVDQARDFGILPDRSGRRPRIARASLETLGKILLPQLQQAARDSTLVSAPNFLSIIPAWKYLGGAAAVKKWIEANIQSNPEFLSKLTKGFVSWSPSTSERIYSMHELPDPDLFDRRTLLRACIEHLEGDQLTQDARNRIRTVATALERNLEQHPDTGSDDVPTSEGPTSSGAG
jgi:hypothetical protein